MKSSSMTRKCFCVLLCMAALASGSDAQARRRVVVLHTNDTHSHIDPLRTDGSLGVIERAAYVDSVIAADGKRNVLYLDAGDFDQGSSYFNVLNGDLEARLLRTRGLDAVALGNHEFDNGIDELARRLRIYSGVTLCANYDFGGTPLEKLVKPCTVFRRGGYRIGVIGLLTDVSKVVAEPVAKQLNYLDPVEITEKYVSYLRDRKRCDIVLVLSHLGFDADCHLARNSRGITAIVGGHSHTDLSKPAVTADLDGKPVTVVTAHCWGSVVGRLEIFD